MTSAVITREFRFGRSLPGQAMQHLASEPYTLGSPPGDHVFWHEPGDDLALPYPDAIAPLAESRTRPELDA